MIQKFISAVLSILLLIGLAGCDAVLGTGMTGMIRELEDHQDGIRQELGELWDAFLEEAGEWPLNPENREE